MKATNLKELLKEIFWDKFGGEHDTVDEILVMKSLADLATNRSLLLGIVSASGKKPSCDKCHKRILDVNESLICNRKICTVLIDLAIDLQMRLISYLTNAGNRPSDQTFFNIIKKEATSVIKL